MTDRTYWIGVASHAHVRTGVAEGFCMLGHGKHAPVKRLNAGDLLVYYSPRETLDPKSEAVQAFTAMGEILPGEPYLADMSPTRQGYRRDVAWWKGTPAPVKPVIAALSFIKDPARWGYPFHRGAFKVSREDMTVIAAAMKIKRKI